MKKFLSSRFDYNPQRTMPAPTQERMESSPYGASIGAINDLFTDYKIQFIHHNFAKIEKIIVSIMQINQNAPVLHLIHAEIFLYRGNFEKSHYHLMQYINTGAEIDAYALSIVAVWNDFAGFRSLAAKQYAYCLDGFLDYPVIARILFNIITIKKQNRFLDTALRYYNRLLAIPEGYRLYPCIQTQIIHIYVLKNDFNTALEAISIVSMYYTSPLIKRLNAYINYRLKRYKNILTAQSAPTVDPYIAYLIARVGIEDDSFKIDVPLYLSIAAKSVANSPHVHNTFGNYYLISGEYSDAMVHYEHALAINSKFQPSRINLQLAQRLAKKPNRQTASGEPANITPVETDPDVEDAGFLFIWSMLGYTNFKFNPAKPFTPLHLAIRPY